MFLEIIGMTAADVLAIQQAGGNRVELVADIEQDGLTPSETTIESALSVAHIPIRVMVRPHNHSFVFTRDEINQMAKWIKKICCYPVDGFVIGGLTPDGHIDEYLLAKCLEMSDGKPCTFHRAFDRVANQLVALNTIKHFPAVDTVLTSGGITSPILSNIEQLKTLQKHAENVTILAGGGVNQQVIELLKNSNVNHFHIGRAAREQHNYSQPISAIFMQQLLSD